MSGSDAPIAARLRAGDEAAMRSLVEQHHRAMLGVAQRYARDRDTAREIVQDSWLAVIEGIASFEGRSSLKTWILAIVANKARSRVAQDARTVPIDELEEGSGLDPARFDASGHWASPILPWDEITPERLAGDRELLSLLAGALDKLPRAQRAAVLLRDVEGLSTGEACNILDVSETNLRVLLHRARTRLRAVLETSLAPSSGRPGKR